MVTSTIVGLCTSHSDKDLWFSDTPDTESGKGRPNLANKHKMIARTVEALNICGKCPVQRECLQEGMKPQNSDYGVWGGTLPGERLIDIGRSLGSSEVRVRVEFAKQVREAQRLLQEPSTSL
jgi:hypothetical protein